MDTLLALTIDGYGTIETPEGIPTGGISSGNTILQNGITIILVSAVVLSLFMLLWGGITWITSGGDKAKVESARKRLIFAIIGLVLIFISFFIISIIGGLMGVELLLFDAGNLPPDCTEQMRTGGNC